MSSLMPGFGLGAPSYVEGLGLAPGAPLSSGFIHGIGLGFGGGSMFAGPAPKIKGPIKYAPVIFPYSSKPSK